MQWLAIGVFANGVAFLPFALVQGAGRSDVTGKLHLLELPFYLVAVWTLTKYFSIDGTAIAWAGRVTADCALLFWAAERQLGRLLPLKTVFAGAAIVAALFAVNMLSTASLPIKALIAVIELTTYAFVAWTLVISAQERSFLKQRLSGSASPSLKAVS